MTTIEAVRVLRHHAVEALGRGELNAFQCAALLEDYAEDPTFPGSLDPDFVAALNGAARMLHGYGAAAEHDRRRTSRYPAGA